MTSRESPQPVRSRPGEPVHLLGVVTVVPFNDIETLARGVVALARRSVLERYGVGPVMAQYRALYDDLRR